MATKRNIQSGAPETKRAIQQAVSEMMNRVMQKVLEKDPFLVDKHHADKPLYAALVPDEIFKGSHFERRFVTPFGNVWEKLAVTVAKNKRGDASTQHRIDGQVAEERLRRISEVLNNLEHTTRGKGRVSPDWSKELNYIRQGAGKKIPVAVVCDLYVVDKTSNSRQSFELKAPLPNSDQTKVSKEKLLKLYSMEPMRIDEAYFALPYNPYGKREDYDWSFPKRWFNMVEDEVVLIGEQFWDALGGQGTFDAFLAAINEIGPEYKERIYRDYLGIEPPDGSLDPILR